MSKSSTTRTKFDANAYLRGVQVRREPLTYELAGKNSYFADLIRAHKGGRPDALARLERHQQEMQVEGRANPVANITAPAPSSLARCGRPKCSRPRRAPAGSSPISSRSSRCRPG